MEADGVKQGSEASMQKNWDPETEVGIYFYLSMGKLSLSSHE